MEEVSTLKETKHEISEIATSVEVVNTPLEAVETFADRIFYTADAVDMKDPLLDDFLDEDLEDTSDSEQDELTILILELYSFKSCIDCSSNQRTNTQSDQLLTMISLLQVSNCPNLSKVLRPKESVNTVDSADIYYLKMTAVII